MHPTKEIYGTISDKLKDKKIVLCTTGSTAVVETVKLIRELIRHGCNVYVVMSKNAQKIISKDALHFASGNKVITEITGELEHVKFCGEVKDKADLLLIAPCTANTISKIVNGIDDTTVTTFVTTAFPHIPIMIVPAMHFSMYRNIIIMSNIKKLKALGIEFIEPNLEEGKAKIASNDEIVEKVIRKIGNRDMYSKKVLIISGSTFEPIDDIRGITNRSSGKTGIELAKNAFERGADVNLWYGQGIEKPPSYIPTTRFETVNELMRLVENLNNYEIIAVCSAISDFTVNKKKGKIPSDKKLTLNLKPTKKVIENIRKKSKAFLIGFKAEINISKEELIEKAYKRLKEVGMDLIVANDISELTYNENHVFIINKKKEVIEVEGKKSHISEKIWNIVSKEVK